MIAATTKTCSKCGEEKTLEAFSRKKDGKHGVRSVCRECDKARVKACYKELSSRDKLPEPPSEKKCSRCHKFKNGSDFSRDRTTTDGLHGKCRECVSQYTSSPAGLAVAARQRARHPHKFKARYAVQAAVRDGRLHRLPCQCCGKDSTKTQGHHEDYSRHLDVIWLCRMCHADIHTGHAIVTDFGQVVRRSSVS